jgi:hypothetical protein
MREKWNLAENAPVVKGYKTFIDVHSLLPEPRIQKGYSYINWIVKFKVKLLGRKVIMRLARKLINWQANLGLIN